MRKKISKLLLTKSNTDKNKKTTENKFELKTQKPSIDTNIYLFGEIDQKASEKVISELNEIMEMLDYHNIEDSNIYVHVNSEGGDVSDMFAITDMFNVAKKRGFIVNTIGVGKIMSAALIILASGTKGNRFVGKNSRLMFHEVSGDISGAHNFMKNEYKEIKWAESSYIKTIVSLSNKDKKFYDSLLKRKDNYYFTAKEALDWGIVDKIL